MVDIVTRAKYYRLFLLIIVHRRCKVEHKKILDTLFH